MRKVITNLKHNIFMSYRLWSLNSEIQIFSELNSCDYTNCETSKYSLVNVKADTPQYKIDFAIYEPEIILKVQIEQGYFSAQNQTVHSDHRH
jgi:hypothetical protein